MKHSGAEEQCHGRQELEVGGGESGCGCKGVARKSPPGDKMVMDLECGGGYAGENIAQKCVCVHVCARLHTHVHAHKCS